MKRIIIIILSIWSMCSLFAQNKIIVKIDTSAKIQMLSTTGARGNVGITGGNSVTVNVNDNDSVTTNELITAFSKNGNQITITESGIDRSINISNTTPSDGQVLKFSSGQWQAGTDLTGGGGGGSTYTSGDGINVNNTTFVISNTRDIQKSGNQISLTNGSSINISSTTPTNGQILKWNGVDWYAAEDLQGAGGGSGTVTSVAIANGGGLTVSGSPITSSGTITITANDQSAFNEAQTLSYSGNLISLTSVGGFGGGSFNLSSNTPLNGQVLKWNGLSWEASTDLSGSGGGSQTLSTTGTAGNISISGGNTITLNVDDADSDPSNETDRIGVSGSLVGGGRLMNYTQGFSNGNGTALVITGATASVSTSSNGGSITWTLPDASPTNEIQTISKTGNTVNLTSGGSFNISTNTPIAGQVLKWDGSGWAADNDLTGSGGGGGTTQTLSTTGAAGNISISDGNTLNLNVNDADADPNNELQSLSVGLKSGSTVPLNITSGVGVNMVNGNGINITRDAANQFTISNTGVITETDPTVGSHIKAITTTDISNWNNDLTGITTLNGQTGVSQSFDYATSGLYPSWNSVSNTHTFRLPSGTINQVLKHDGLGWTVGSDNNSGGTVTSVAISNGGGISVSGSPITNSGVITLTAADQSSTNEAQSISKSGNLVTLSSVSTIGGGSFQFSENTPTNGQVLGWNGTNWVAQNDQNTTYTAGSGLTLSGTQFINTGDLSTSNELITNFVKSGNNITITENGANWSIPISASAPATNQVLKWNGSEWAAADDAVGTGGGGGATYTGGTGITVDNTAFTITNTGDLSNINELDVLRVSGSVTGGGKLQNATNGVNQASEVNLVINGATASVTTGVNGGITWTLPVDQTGITSIGGQTGLSQSFAYGMAGLYPSWSSATNTHTFRLPTGSSGQVLKHDGVGWTVGADNNSGGTVTSVGIVNGGGINVSGSPITTSGSITLTAADQSSTNEAQTLSKGGNEIILSSVSGVGGGIINLSQTAIPSNGQVLKWDGLQWNAANDNDTNSGGTVTSINVVGSTGITATGGPITSSGTINLSVSDQSPTNEAQSISKSGNLVTMTSVSGVGGGAFQFSENTPINGQVLGWNGTNWVAQNDQNTTYTAGTGLSLVGNQFNNIGDLSNVNEGLMTLSGTISPYTYNSNTTSSTPLILAQGSGIIINRSGNTLSFLNAGDLSETNEIQSISTNGSAGNITLSDGGTLNLNVNDADADPNNEIQTLSLGTKTGSTIPINLTPSGGTVNMIHGSGINITRDASNQFTVSNTGVITETDPTVGSHIKAITTTDISNWNNDLTGITSLGGLSAISQSLAYGTAGIYPSWSSATSTHTFRLPSGTNGQVLKHDGVDWRAQADDNTTQTLGTGTNTITLSGGGGSVGLRTINGNTLLGSTNIVTPNIYNSDGTITDIIRNVNLSGNTLLFNGAFNGRISEVQMGGSIFSSNIANGSIFSRMELGDNYFRSSNSGTTRISNEIGVASMSHQVSGQPWKGIEVTSNWNLLTRGNLNPSLMMQDDKINIITPSLGININGSTGSAGQVLTSNGTTDGVTWQTPPSAVNIYNTNGTIPSSTTRTVSLGTSTDLEVGVYESGPFLYLEKTIANTELGYNGNKFFANTTQSGVVNNLDYGFYALNNSGIRILDGNNSLGSNNQVLTSNGSTATWQTPSDGSSVNEAQTLSTSTNQILLSNVSGFGGGTVNLRTVGGQTILGTTDISVNDADANPTNEAQTLSTSTNQINLGSVSGVGGGTVNLKTVNGESILGTGNISAGGASYDNVYSTGVAFVSFPNNSDAAVFTGTSASGCSVTSTTLTKSSSSAIYEINISLRTSDFMNDYVVLGLYRSGSLIRLSSQNNTNISGDTDMHFKFITDNLGGGLTIRNISGGTINADITYLVANRIR